MFSLQEKRESTDKSWSATIHEREKEGQSLIIKRFLIKMASEF